MFNFKLFGYNRNQVDEFVGSLSEKINTQQRDLDYLRHENERLKNRLKQTKKSNKEGYAEK